MKNKKEGETATGSSPFFRLVGNARMNQIEEINEFDRRNHFERQSIQ